MTTHVLIACSKSKSAAVAINWELSSDMISWSKRWHDQNELYSPENLYTGRSFRQQLLISSKYPNFSTYVISAGAGLVSLDDEIPCYEATFRKGKGPVPAEWHLLPCGGISRLRLKPGDTIVSFAPPQYHRALLHDPALYLISDELIVPSTSPLAPVAGTVVEVHPRSKEVLKASSIDLNTRLLEIFLTEGIEGLHSLYKEAELLPPLAERVSVSDEELYAIVNNLPHITSNASMVRHLRDELKIKASSERIGAARKKAMESDSKKNNPN